MQIIEIILLFFIGGVLMLIAAGDYQAHIFGERVLKKWHYKRSRYSVMRNLWDIEFKRDSCEAAREAERLVFEQISEQIAAYTVRIDKLKERNEPSDEEDLKQSNDKIQELLDARKMHQEQMDVLDGQKTQLSKNIDDLRSIVGLIEDKIRKT